MKLLTATRGMIFTVDDEDYDEVAQHKWSILSAGRKADGTLKCYVVRSVRQDGQPRKVLLHRFLMGLEYGDPRQVDHRNGDPMDNRRANLRICTPMENSRSRGKKRSPSQSRYVGVSRNRSSVKPWRAQIVAAPGLPGSVYLGGFPTEEEAALAYNKAAAERFGQFARLNIVALNEVTPQ